MAQHAALLFHFFTDLQNWPGISIHKLCINKWFISFYLPDTSSASEDEGSLRRQAALSAVLNQSLQNTDSWINKSIQGSSTSSSASSTLSHGDVKSTSGSLADVLANTHIGKITGSGSILDKILSFLFALLLQMQQSSYIYVK